MIFDVSFIIPAYNEEKLIANCIRSIITMIIRDSSLYGQRSIGNFEIIIVDNNSTDKTAEIANSFFDYVKVLSCPTKGVTHARQVGYRSAKYNIQAYIDADSTLPIGWCKNLKEFEDINLVAISGPVRYPESSKFFYNMSKIFYRFGSFFHSMISPMIQGGNFVVRKEALDKIGGHSTNIAFYGEDTDLAKRISKIGKVKFIPEMWNHSSSRRFKEQGMINTTVKYIMNYFWITLFDKPFTKEYKDYRN